jgi:hypothetical protein
MLRIPMPPSSALICYADDTLMLVWGSAWDRTVCLAEMAVDCVVATIRELGLEVSSQNIFSDHFDHLIPSVEAAANALGSLLPRLDGSGGRVRWLYAGVVRSKLLYGAPIWAADLMANRLSVGRIGQWPSGG